MEISAAQRDVRTTFVGGFAGQMVSGVLWGCSAACATWGTLRTAELVLVLGGFFIFPLTLAVLRLMGRPAGLPKGHPMNGLGMQVAFTLPLSLPVVFAAAAFRAAWFYPAFMIVLGAHYVPFIFSYGMWQFGVLAWMLVAGGMGLGMWGGELPVSTGAWGTAAVLFGFAWLGRWVAERE